MAQVEKSWRGEEIEPNKAHAGPHNRQGILLGQPKRGNLAFDHSTFCLFTELGAWRKLACSLAHTVVCKDGHRA